MSEHIKVQVPSNIAFLKYWGKVDATKQIPANNSLSMTLSLCVTTTTVQKSSINNIIIEGAQERELAKPYAHLNWLQKECGFKGALSLHSKNSFPLGCGIASSASGMAALTLAVLAYYTGSNSYNQLLQNVSLPRLSYLVRMGSGSACRSLLGGYVSWEYNQLTNQQKVVQLYSADYWQLCDVVVVVKAEAKTVSSTKGQALAPSSLLYKLRVVGHSERELLLKQALADKNWQQLGSLLEIEALEMHAVMLTSKPALCYLLQATCDILQWVRQQRQQANLSVYFTLDAGANPHLLCQKKDLNRLQQLVKKSFPQYPLILDHVGTGPVIEYVS